MNQDLSILHLVMHASVVVQIVMAILMLVSLASWSIIFAKVLGLKRVRQDNDTFDRDFALSLVSSEQEALTEIDAAIKRIHDGTYGVCEITQKPIAKERLLAVPFTRYSAEAQKDIERNRHRARTQAGLFGEMGEEGGVPPILCVSSDGRFWLAGGSYTCPSPGITN